ncbi:MAG: hypothetical protein AAFR96_09170, partial [Planctomycetota bacterium]
IIRGYFDRMREYRDDHYALHKIRTRISWLVKPLNSRQSSAKPLQQAIRTAPDAAAVYDALARFEAGELRNRGSRVSDVANQPAPTGMGRIA